MKIPVLETYLERVGGKLADVVHVEKKILHFTNPSVSPEFDGINTSAATLISGVIFLYYRSPFAYKAFSFDCLHKFLFPLFATVTECQHFLDAT